MVFLGRIAVLLLCSQVTSGFQVQTSYSPFLKELKSNLEPLEEPIEGQGEADGAISRRKILDSAVAGTAGIILGATAMPQSSSAVVGSLPEFAETNAIIQGITVNVVEKSQQDAMIDFLVNGFDFSVLRRRIKDSVEETWLGFGPEQLSIPDDFELPVSALSRYGGHASICIRFDSSASALFYRQGDDAPGDNIAFLQVGVPGYRISQMVAYGGKILDAYGLVNVVSPCGLPMRGIVGISPDPMMLVAINCKNVKESVAFYEQLGFLEQDYPFSRPSKGTTMFEPDKPKNAVYMSPSPNCMGVLLLQNKSKRVVTPNPAVDSLNIVYTPSGSVGDSAEVRFKDLSGLGIRLQTFDDFFKEEMITK